MSEPMFVSVGADTWVNVEHIAWVRPDRMSDSRCVVGLVTGEEFMVSTPARDFLNRMTGVIWK